MKKLSIFTSRGERFFSAVVSWITKPKHITAVDVPSHCGIVFDDKEYFEALAGREFRGPIPIENLYEWRDRKLSSRWVNMYKVSTNKEAVERVYSQAMALKGKWDYGEWQLVFMFLQRRLGLNFYSSEKKVVCSEAVAKLTHEILTWTKPYDYITPMDVQITASGKEIP